LRESLQSSCDLGDLADRTARDELEEEERLITAETSLWPDEIHKASPDDPKHPGWPAGTPDGRGGKFRPKDSTSALTDKIKNLVKRDRLRMNLTAALHVGIEALVNLIPGVDVAADVMVLTEIARAAVEYRKLSIEAEAALKFVQNAPYSLEDLQVSGDYKEFPSSAAFVKALISAELMSKYFGSAGEGSQYHHIVTQGGVNADNIPATQLQNTDNIIVLPTLLHEIVSDEYLGPAPDGSHLTLYQWLQKQSPDVQRDYGLSILRSLHILK
jgi:hypothetical protein